MITFFFGLFGAMIGSFLNALIYRLPRNINIAFPRSSCTTCNKVITWWENIPVLSYLFLRGKCSGCKSKISPLYPLIEIISAIASILLMPHELNLTSITQYFMFFSIFCAFLVHFVIDLKHQILPDSINIYLASLFGIMAILQGEWMKGLIGGLLGLGFPLLVSWIFYKLKGQVGLGGGDIKLYGALGIFLGPIMVMQNIFLSCFLGALIGLLLIAIKIMKRENHIPFGPFIIVVASVQIFLPDFYRMLMAYIP